MPSDSGQKLPLDTWGPRAKVALAPVARGAASREVAEATWRAALAASDFAWLTPGDRVFVKPVINSGNPYPATTSPTALGAMVELLYSKGAGQVLVGDMSGVGHVRQRLHAVKGASTRRMAELCGLAQIATRAGAEMSFFEESGWESFFHEAPGLGSAWPEGLYLPEVLRQVDHIVLMPRCGRHSLLGSTLGLKAVVGYMRFDTRLAYHRQAGDIHARTVEANLAPTLLAKQRLVVSAADKVLTTYGPDKGYVAAPDPGLIMVSPSVVAHDLVSLAWLLINREQTPSGQLGALNDPNASPWVANLANHAVVGLLGGLVAGLSAQRLESRPLHTVGDDPVLAHASRLMGGAPEVELVTAGSGLPPELAERLAAMTGQAAIA